MNNYYYSQTFGGYKNFGIGTPTMGQKGCVVTSLAMILSYFNDKAFYPDQMLSWGRENGMLDDRGNTRFEVFCKAAGGKLRISFVANAQPGEVTYAIREVKLSSGLPHWVIDHPIIPNMIIDSYDGKVKTHNSFNFTGRVYYYIGKK